LFFRSIAPGAATAGDQQYRTEPGRRIDMILVQRQPDEAAVIEA
jgi:hypothetical protein